MNALNLAALKRQLATLSDEYSGLSPQVAAQIAADALEALEAREAEWEYEYRPVTSNPDEPEWAGRSREAVEELIAAHADPTHYIHAEHNSDMSPVVGFNTYRRVPAGPWMPVSSAAIS